MKPQKLIKAGRQAKGEEEQYPISSESEWSCRVEGSGSQCNVLIQPNHQTVLVRERQDRQTERKRMRNAQHKQKMSHKRDRKDRERRRGECVLIVKQQRASEMAERRKVTINQV